MGSRVESGRTGPVEELGVPRTSVDEELGFHEALLRRGEPSFRVALVSRPAVSFGVGVPPQAEYLRRSREIGMPVVARSTGGTGALHLENDILWAIVLPRSDPRVGADFVRAYARLGRPVVAGLAASRVRSVWVPAPGLVQEYCPLSSRGEVLVTDQGIVGGAAQHLTSQALLHEGGLSWTVDRAAVDQLFGLPTGGPSMRLAGISEARSVASAGVLAAALARALGAELRP